jgi:hypothetical protein
MFGSAALPNWHGIPRVRPGFFRRPGGRPRGGDSAGGIGVTHVRRHHARLNIVHFSAFLSFVPPIFTRKTEVFEQG